MQDPQKPEDKHRKGITVILLIMLFIIPVGFISKAIPYTFIAIRCGQLPIESMTRQGDNVYKTAGDKGYGISVFSDYSFCTEDEAKAAGYSRDILAE